VNPPAHPGEYFSHAGPRDGPIHDGDVPGSIGVHDRPDAPNAQVGIAHSVTQVRHRRKSVMVWRITIGKEELPGRWVCIGRRFIEVGDWQEREAIREEG
jgi:hypothetical protein